MLKLVDLSDVESVNSNISLVRVMHNKYYVMLGNKLIFNEYNAVKCNDDLKIANKFAANLSFRYKQNFDVRFIEKIYLPIDVTGYNVVIDSFSVIEEQVC